MTTRIKDLPDDAAPGSTDRIPIDGTTTRSSTITNLSTKIASLLNSAAAVLTNKSISGATNTLTNIGGTSIRMGSDAQGDVLYFDGTNYVRLAAGASGRFLKTLGAGANPAWAAVPGGGDMLAANNLSDLVSASTARTNLGVRDRLTATRDYYVRADGSDSNTGLVNNAGGAWLTLQKAWDYIQANIDVAGQTVRVNISDGTYSGMICEGNVPGVSTARPIKFVGNTTTPTNVTISGGGSIAIKIYNSAAVSISGLTLTGLYGITSSDGAWAGIDTKVVFGTCTNAQMYAFYNGEIEVLASYTINGNSPAHAQSDINSIIVYQSGITITYSGSPGFSFGFFAAQRCGVVQAYNIVQSGSAGTTKMYYVDLNGVVDTSATWTLPGGTAGTTQTGGQFT